MKKKRTLDLLLLLCGAPAWAPALGLSAALVLWRSGRPILFTQQRMGRHQRPFTIYKLRTMEPHERPPKGALFAGWTYQGDPRVTPVGRFLRRYRLDELPQLFNVLKGDMSLVGPRPEPYEVAAALGEQIPDYHQRHQVPPGLTGLCQIDPIYTDFGTVEKSARKLKLDLDYVRRRSLRLDASILARTLGVLWRGHGMA